MWMNLLESAQVMRYFYTIQMRAKRLSLQKEVINNYMKRITCLSAFYLGYSSSFLQ